MAADGSWMPGAHTHLSLHELEHWREIGNDQAELHAAEQILDDDQAELHEAERVLDVRTSTVQLDHHDHLHDDLTSTEHLDEYLTTTLQLDNHVQELTLAS